MADVQRTINEFLDVTTGLFKDNTAGDISAQDLRDLVASVAYGLRGRIFGLEISRNVTDPTNDIDIATGVAWDNDTDCLLRLLSALTKQLDASWAVGTNQGGLDTGTIANTTYYVWLIRRSDTAVVDALFSTSSTAPTMPTGYDQKRVIGKFLRKGGAIASSSLEYLAVNHNTLYNLDVGDVHTQYALNTHPFLTVSADSRLSGESVLTAGTGVTLTAGAGTLTVASSVLRGYIDGLILSNNGTDATNDIDVAVGGAWDNDNSYLIRLTSAITKRLDASWAVGTNAGGLDTGAIANGTYHVWLIRRSDTGVVDVLFSTSATSPTMPTSYDQKRRIGSILRESATIVGFVQNGDIFQRKTPAPPASYTSANPGTAAITLTLSVPTGVKVLADIGVVLQDLTSAGGLLYSYLSDLDVTDQTPSAAYFTTVLPSTATTITQFNGTRVPVRTNTSAQIRSRINISNADIAVFYSVYGWIDSRGKDA